MSVTDRERCNWCALGEKPPRRVTFTPCWSRAYKELFFIGQLGRGFSALAVCKLLQIQSGAGSALAHSI